MLRAASLSHTVSAHVDAPLLSPACLLVRQLPILPPRRPNILALHKFLMSVLKSPATSTHWSLNLLGQTNIVAYTCFCTLLVAVTSHMLYSEEPGLEVLNCRQLQDYKSFLSPGAVRKRQSSHDTGLKPDY